MTTNVYQAGVFESLAASPLGQQLWALLNEAEARIRMRTASDLGRPAVEALEEQLLERFGDKVLEDRVKQMIGHMTRQVMAQEGYVVDAQNVKITGGAPFSRGTRYRRPDATTFHVWKLTTDPHAFVLTADKSDSRLPTPNSGEWKYWKSLDGALRACVLLGLSDIPQVRANIAADGYHEHRQGRLLRAPKP